MIRRSDRDQDVTLQMLAEMLRQAEAILELDDLSVKGSGFGNSLCAPWY